MKHLVALLVLAFLVIHPAVYAQEAPSANPSTATPAASGIAPAVSANIHKRVEDFLRTLYAWGPAFQVTIGPIKPTAITDLYEVAVQVSNQGQSDAALVYVTKDAHFIIRGDMQDLTKDPLADIRRDLHLQGAASKGPVDAKVVVVEFGDFECPVCRQLELVLSAVLPKYPQVRFVFKDFPLEEIHPWALSAALAGQCAVQKSPESFWKLHDAIYENQDLISPQNAFDKLTDLAKQADIDTDSFKACMADSKTAVAVQKSIDEGTALDVNSTPTIFVDGRRIVGPSEQTLQQFIEFDLQHP